MTGSISLAVFARNEAAALPGCLAAIERALEGLPAGVTVVLNGTTDDSAAAVRRFAAGSALSIRLFDIPFADKSNAWNQYVHALAPDADLHVFVDAYAAVTPGAVRALAAALAANPQALAAAALPSCGRSAPAQRAAMRRSPALHGSLHALRGSLVARIRAGGLRLPVGLYRGDGLIGAMVLHDLDPAANPWDTGRIALAEEATWTVAPLSPFRPRDLRRLWNRRIQQARGAFEDAALQEVIYRNGFAALPAHADVMLADWLARNPAATAGRSPFPRLARSRLATPRTPSAADLQPVLLPVGPAPGSPLPRPGCAEGAGDRNQPPPPLARRTAA